MRPSQATQALRLMGQRTEQILRAAYNHRFLARQRAARKRLQADLDRLRLLYAAATGAVFLQPSTGQLCLDWGK